MRTNFLYHKDGIMTQYSKRTALLHWLIFLLIIAAFFFGHELDESKNTAQKLSMFPVHFLLGGTVLLLTLVRIYVRKKDGEPAPANANPLLNKIAAATHGLLNLSVIGVTLAGAATALTSGVLDAISKNDPTLIPDFDKVKAMEIHQLFIGLLLVLAAFHIAAALYHQFIVKDNLLRRIMVRRF
jgi:cytochrome b561